MRAKFLHFIILLAVLFSLALPASTAQAASKKPARLNVNNQAQETVQLRLYGNPNYTFYVKHGKVKLEVEHGVYTYNYTACGKTNTGSLDLNGATAKLVIAKCPVEKGITANKKAKTAKSFTFPLKNNTGGWLNLVLTGGPGTFTFYLPAGETRLTLQGGKYKYQATGCGGATKRGSINISRGLKSWTWTCTK